MLKSRLAAGMVTAGLMIVNAGMAHSQNFPVKPIRIITSDPGGGSDVVLRIIAPAVSSGLGQQVIIDNRAGGVIAGDAVSKAPPDGHTLIYYANTLWLLPLLQKNVPYDTVRDFAPVTLAVTGPNILVVHPSLPVKSVKELIVLAKARPGELNYASAAAGTSNHIAAELFKSMTGVNIVRITYKGIGAGITDALGGHVQMVFGSATSVAAHIRSGRFRALAISSAQPSAAFPELPTIAATVPGYESASYGGVLAPAKTPEAIINRLNQEFARALNQPDIKEKFLVMGVDVVASTPGEFASKIKSEIAAVGKIIKDGGIVVN